MEINISTSPEDIERCISIFEALSKVNDRTIDRLAICCLKAGRYVQAKHLFQESCQAMLQPPQKRFRSTFPNRLVDAYVLSGESSSYSEVMDWLITYRLTQDSYAAYSPIACYSYSVMELLSTSPKNIAPYLEILLKQTKFKDMYAIGLTLQAIANKDNDAFTTSLSQLLSVHASQVKRGSLRQSGTDCQCLCMFAMSLSYLANNYGLVTNLENEYLSTDYLKFLRQTDSEK